MTEKKTGTRPTMDITNIIPTKEVEGEVTMEEIIAEPEAMVEVIGTD